MSRIVDDFQSMPICNLLYLINVTRVSVDMSGDDARGAFSYGGFEQSGIDGQRVWVDIHQHRSAVLPDNGRRCSHIAERGCNNLAHQPQRLYGDLQRQGPVRHEQDMLNSEV